MTERENFFRVVHFDRPDHIPMVFSINSACWHHYPHGSLQELMASHPLLFPGYTPGPAPSTRAYSPEATAGHAYTDPWGCVWETTDDGIVGVITHHPLASWDRFDSYKAPDPDRDTGRGPVDWTRLAEQYRRARLNGRVAHGGLPHGHTFLLLSYIRGYENVLLDMADGEPRLVRLIDIVEQFNSALVQRHLAAGVECMGYAEDLGMQVGPLLSPAHLRRYLKPVYQRLMAPARQHGCIVHMHSDGDIRALAPDLIDGGVQIVNLQDMVNGLDWIRQNLTGKVCVELDVDRQSVTRFGTPAQVDALIREEVTRLGSREGGLMLIFGLYPGTPLANVKALMDAMERYAGFYS